MLGPSFPSNGADGPGNVVAGDSGIPRAVVGFTDNAATADALARDNDESSCLVDAIMAVKSDWLACADADVGNLVFLDLNGVAFLGFQTGRVEDSNDFHQTLVCHLFRFIRFIRFNLTFDNIKPKISSLNYFSSFPFCFIALVKSFEFFAIAIIHQDLQFIDIFFAVIHSKTQSVEL